MKKSLLFCAALATAGVSFGQVLQSQTFETFTLGNLGTQGGFSTLGGTASSYTIVSGNGGKTLNITGGTGTGTTAPTSPNRYAWVDGLDTAWNNRTTGNNVIRVSYDFFTGPILTGSGLVGSVDLYDAPYNYLARIFVDANTKTAIAHTTAGGNAVLTPLGATGGQLALPPNTWVRLSYAYDTITGTARFVGPGFDKTVTGNDPATPFEIDYTIDLFGTTNNTAATFGYDNLTATAVASTNVLATEETEAKAISLEVFPNPTTDYLQVQTPEKIEKVYLYTADGIRMDAQLVDGKVNVSALPKGVYLLGVKTAKTYATKKFIKK